MRSGILLLTISLLMLGDLIAQQKDKEFRSFSYPENFPDSLSIDTLFTSSWKDLKRSNIRYAMGKEPQEMVTGPDTFRLLLPDKDEMAEVFIERLTIIADPQEFLVFDQLESSSAPVIKTPSRFDSRVEINALSADYEEFIRINQRAKDIYCVVEREVLDKVDEDRFLLNVPGKLGATYNLCDSEPYIEQPTVCLGTAFLANEHHLLTARHVLDHHDLSNLVFIRSFQLVTPEGAVNTIIPTADVLSGDHLVGESELGNFDLAMISLKKPAIYHGTELSGRTMNRKDRVYALGHPLGLPMKATLRASIQSEDNYHYFTTLDTFQGNSGSPVYSKATHKVIGVLIGGGADFQSNGDCLISRLCISSDCQKEKVLRIDAMLPLMSEYLNKERDEK